MVINEAGKRHQIELDRWRLQRDAYKLSGFFLLLPVPDPAKALWCNAQERGYLVIGDALLNIGVE